MFLTQDSLPRDNKFLETLVAPLNEPNVVGAWARVLPRSDDDPLTERTALVQPEAAELGYAVKGDSKWKTTGVEERLLRVRLNNVASAARRDFFEENPFPDVAFGEDLAWALAALDSGRELRFVPQAVVSHAHRYSLSACFERNRVDAAFQRLQFGRLVRPSFGAVLRGLAYEVREDVRFILGRRKARALYLCWSPFLRGAQILGQFFGTRGWNSARGEEATRKIN